MLTKILNLLTRLATGRNILVLLAVFVAFNALILPWAEARIKASSGGIGPIDLQFSYTPEQAYSMVTAYREEGRRFYMLFELTGDLLYPLTIFLLFGLLLTYLADRAFPGREWVRQLALLPLGGFAADYLENAGIVIMLVSYPSQPPAVVAQAASLFTTIKWLFAGVTIVLTLIGLAAWLVRIVWARVMPAR